MLNLITFMISDSRAATVLARRIGGSVEQWRIFLEKDRKRELLGEPPRVPFHGEHEDPSYGEDWVYKFARRIEKKRGVRYMPPQAPRWLPTGCTAAADFDHEHERPMVMISACAGFRSAGARLPLEAAKEFVSEVSRIVEQLEGKTTAEILASYGAFSDEEANNG